MRIILAIAIGLLSYGDGLNLPQIKARFMKTVILHSRVPTKDDDNGFVHTSILEEVTPTQKSVSEYMGGNQAIFRSTQHHTGTVDEMYQNFLSSDEIVPAEIFSNDTTLTIEAIDEILAVVQQAVSKTDTLQEQNLPEAIPLQQSASEETIAKVTHLDDVVAPIEKQDSEDYEYPSARYIISFAASAIGVYLCSPLLSMIDTSAVGLLSGTAQQAALNPAVAVTDYGALLMSFLYTGATNLVAAAQERDKGDIGHPRTINKFSTALQLSTYVGIALGSSLLIFARPLLRTLVGNEGISPEVFDAAMKYVRIRALGMPAAALIGSAQAGCLGMQDVKSPMFVLVAAALVNFFGDMVFVRMNNPYFGGAAGAAWATIFSQYFAVWLFFRWLCTVPKTQQVPKDKKVDFVQTRVFRGERSQERISLARRVVQKIRFESSSTKIRNKNGTEWTTRGLFRGKYSGFDLLSFPSIQRAREFGLYFVPVTTTSIGRLSSYVAMSHVVSSTLGTTAMAAQQIIVSLFYCLTPIADSLSLTAQSMIPRLMEKAPSSARTAALKATVRNLYKAGGIFGGIMMSAVMFIPFITQLFTSDASVMALVTSVIPMLLAFFGVHGLCMASEGILLGQKDLTFIGSMYGSFFLLVPYLMLRVKKAAIAGVLGIKLTSIWSIFVGYQIVRVLSFLMRCNQILRRTERNSNVFHNGKCDR